MKIKIFTGTNTEALEKRVNEFLKDKNVIDIKYQSYFDNRFIYDSVLVIYKEEPEFDFECGDSCEIKFES